MRAVIYGRISQDRDGLAVNLGEQIRSCEKLARERGIDVVAVRSDNDVSAFKTVDSRTEWPLVLEMVHRGEVDMILAWALDRCYRQVAQFQTLLDSLGGRPLRIVTVSGQELDLSTPMGRTLAQVLVAFAQMEMQIKSERLAAKYSANAERGQRHGGKRPIGYEADGVTVDPVEAAALIEAAEMIIAGMGLNAATRKFNDATGRGARAVSLKNALKSYRVIGMREYRSEKATREWAERRRAGEVTGEERPPGRISPAVWPAILTTEQWEAVRAVFRQTTRGATPMRAPRSLLSGILRCAKCGSKMGFSPDKIDAQNPSRLKTRATYKCQSAGRGGGCGSVAVSASAIEEFILGVVETVIRDGPPIIVEKRSSDSLQVALEEEIQRLREKAKKHILLAESGAFRVEEIVDRQRAVNSEIAAVEAQLDAITLGRRRVERAVPTSEAWAASTQAERSLTIRALFAEIRVKPSARGRLSGPRFDPDRVELAWAR
ncbi:hypothetical protein FDO65_06915 [Nakamurella flava]|uniref:Recombinase family protein n=1 Tax=Nakamurella flava TaxID=2576308 RepID=A0A4U6QL95_9ACTN|nr:recombinase family protein [Nakamurella flava]TKV61327.1 hypothetical protein FDO65_06915 [Nakamurella flava]